jgi:hypothetical protein
MRFFVLDIDHTLTYYSNNVVKGELKLHGAQVRTIDPSEADGKLYAFEVFSLSSNNKKFSSLKLAAATADEAEAWVAAISCSLSVILASKANIGNELSPKITEYSSLMVPINKI